MMPRMIPDILNDDLFRPLSKLSEDIDEATPGSFPQVIFIEPTYTDAPHFGVSSDDHAPSAIKAGQEFLLTVYRQCMIQNPNIRRDRYDCHLR